MFSDAILEKIFSDKETQKIPIGCQSTMVRVIENILESAGYDFSDTSISEKEEDE